METPLKIGQYNTLTVTKCVDFGIYLDGGDTESDGWGEILLPSRCSPKNCAAGDKLRVFVYFDSEDRIIATIESPKAIVGECAYLRVVDVNTAGAFLDWGLSKNLLVPYSQQAKKMRVGAYYLVAIYQDEESERITASSKISRFLDKTLPDYTLHQPLFGMVMAKTDLGYKVIVEHRHSGMLYANEVFTPLNIGQAVTIQISKIRDDGKLDLKIEAPSKHDLSELEKSIMDKLSANHGLLRLGDKTPPEVIYRAFGVSKKNFKRAVSRLYKQRLIGVEANRIVLPK